jgi:predicted metal-dependent hydrolase
VTVDASGEVEVVLPRRAAERHAAAAVAELRPWIERRLAEHARLRRSLADRGDTVPYLGGTLALIGERGRSRVHRRGEVLLVPPPGPQRLAALERFYRRAAREEVASRLDRACAQAGLSYRGLTIRGQRTRWASCSRSGAMSFNWRLLLAPERILDYVVWHEVCHLAVMDHSPRFWALVAQHLPGYEEPRRWLARHGATLALG